MKRLVHIQAALIVLQVVSIFFLFWYGIKFYSYCNLLNYADEFEVKTLIIDDLSTTSGKSSYSASAIGYIDREKKYLLLGSYSYNNENDFVKESIGDTILVWSAKGHINVKLRKPNEKKFDKNKYQKENRNTIIFVFIPIFLVWIFERMVTKKIKRFNQKN